MLYDYQFQNQKQIYPIKRNINLKLVFYVNPDVKPGKSLAYLFYNCSSLTSLPDISKWNIYDVVTLKGIFSGCSSLKSLPDISKWDLNNVYDISEMFRNCSSLISLPDISKWNTYNINNMAEIFYGCKSLSYLPDISIWKTDNVENIFLIFKDCQSSLPDISKWNLNKIKDKNNILIDFNTTYISSNDEMTSDFLKKSFSENNTNKSLSSFSNENSILSQNNNESSNEEKILYDNIEFYEKQNNEFSINHSESINNYYDNFYN